MTVTANDDPSVAPQRDRHRRPGEPRRPGGTAMLRVDPGEPIDAAVEIVIPVYNEGDHLAGSIHRLHDYLAERFPVPWLITIADNASTDSTWGVACQLVGQLDRVAAAHLSQKGRGNALRQLWTTSRAPVVAYMDVDLSTDLGALLPLVAPLLSGHSDVAIGTRLASNSRVVRGPRREWISRTYNFLLRTTFRAGFSDAQCGFKAMRTEVARQLLPLVDDGEWFFDTELLVLAEHNGFRVHEVPVDWVDDPDSRVDVVGTAKADLRGMARLARRLVGSHHADVDRTSTGRPSSVVDRDLASQLVRFGSIGLVSTVFFAALFVVLRPRLGVLWADVVALGLCAVANTEANRRLTFTFGDRSRLARRHLAGLLLSILPLAANLITLAVLAAAGVESTMAFLIALTVVNGLTALVRFILLRRWVFRP
ncbi:MAG: glycosyltransferase [Acidimicrobiales bacterium]